MKAQQQALAALNKAREEEVQATNDAQTAEQDSAAAFAESTQADVDVKEAQASFAEAIKVSENSSVKASDKNKKPKKKRGRRSNPMKRTKVKRKRGGVYTDALLEGKEEFFNDL